MLVCSTTSLNQSLSTGATHSRIERTYFSSRLTTLIRVCIRIPCFRSSTTSILNAAFFWESVRFSIWFSTFNYLSIRRRSGNRVTNTITEVLIFLAAPVKANGIWSISYRSCRVIMIVSTTLYQAIIDTALFISLTNSTTFDEPS